MRLLLVEDSARLRKALSGELAAAGYQVEAVEDGLSGLMRLRAGGFDLAILDLMLPQMDGLEVLRRVRAEGQTIPVLVLTARDTVPDRVKGLHHGADDYLIKPFAFEELLARLAALARRAYDVHGRALRVGDLRLDLAGHTAARGGRDIPLSRLEFRLLEYLALHQGSVVSKSEIEAHLYADGGEPESNAVDVAVYRLRRKIDAQGEAPLLHTRRGLGYHLGPVAS